MEFSEALKIATKLLGGDDPSLLNIDLVEEILILLYFIRN